MMVIGVTIMTVRDKVVMTDHRVWPITGGQVLNTVIHASLCMIDIMDQTGAGVPITAGRGTQIMADTAAVHQLEGQGTRPRFSVVEKQASGTFFFSSFWLLE